MIRLLRWVDDLRHGLDYRLGRPYREGRLCRFWHERYDKNGAPQ